MKPAIGRPQHAAVRTFHYRRLGRSAACSACRPQPLPRSSLTRWSIVFCMGWMLGCILYYVLYVTTRDDPQRCSRTRLRGRCGGCVPDPDVILTPKLYPRSFHSETNTPMHQQQNTDNKTSPAQATRDVFSSAVRLNLCGPVITVALQAEVAAAIASVYNRAKQSTHVRPAGGGGSDDLCRPRKAKAAPSVSLSTPCENTNS